MSESRGSESQALLHSFGLSVGCAAMQMCLNVRNETVNYRAGITHNVSICVQAGLSKPRGVPDTERTKDTKTLDYASTPLDANTLLCAVFFFSQFVIKFVKVVSKFYEVITPTIGNRNLLILTCRPKTKFNFL